MIQDFTPEFNAQQDELIKQQRWTQRAEELRQATAIANSLLTDQKHTPEVLEKTQ